MMLLKKFYSIISKQQATPQKYNVAIRIDASHEIFNGHFPGNPVMPGVCMMQIIKEITEEIVERELVLQSLTNVKFMALINPDHNPELDLELEITTADNGLIKVKNITTFVDTVALKAAATYRIA
jgi:3-hydroxyacyl-[acyl-carrier-protein] dehydratase